MSALPPAADPEQIFQRYRHDVYGWAYRLLGRHHDALDVAQDVFLRWMRQVRRDPPDHPRSWLRSVTINRAIDLLRAPRPEALAGAETMSASSRGADRSEAEAAELRGQVAAAMAGLSEMQRSVLTAKIHDDLTFAQIAAEHGVAVPTVKTHYLRALRAVRVGLRSHLSAAEGDEP
jgi:RNA polymerase sigma factor (sigma-70 family)